jgi:hypothetical protein
MFDRASQKEAMRRTRLEFGALGRVKEDCRESRVITLLETTVRDVRCSGDPAGYLQTCTNVKAELRQVGTKMMTKGRKTSGDPPFPSFRRMHVSIC